MPTGNLSHLDWIRAAEVPGSEGVYFIGPFNRRITFYSQQVRALRLAHAMDALSIIKPGQRVAVVGAGAAGAMIALALALLGQDVTLYDPATEILQLQSASSRLLHPHIYEWPRLGSLDDRAGLPVMDWSSGTGGAVCAALRAEFAKMKAPLANLKFANGHKLVAVEKIGSNWQLTFETSGEPETRIFQHVALALGFGDERSCGVAVPENYWRPGAIGTPATEPQMGATYIVSGNGDGALTDTLALLITEFEHVTFTRRFLDFFAGDELRLAAEEALSGAAFEQDIEAKLHSQLLPILVTHGVLDRLRPILRKDRAVTINSNGPLFAAGKAAQLNHCMVFAALEAAKLEGIEVKRTTGKVTNVVGSPAAGMTVSGILAGEHPSTNAFKHVILRHGPDINSRYASAANLLATYEAHIRPLLVAIPALGEPPILNEETYQLFEKSRIDKTADYASQKEQFERAAQIRTIIEVVTDRAAHVPVQRGCMTLKGMALECERLPARVTVQLYVPPSQLPQARDLVRLARCSDGKIELAAHPIVREEWQKLLPDISLAPAPNSVRPARDLDLRKLSECVDTCLMRVLDASVKRVVENGQSAPLGTISSAILCEVESTWAIWRTTLNASTVLRFDFLRWLVNVDQGVTRPWNGDRAAVQRMVNALIMMMATHCEEPLAPISIGRGNLQFATDAVALGTGCETIGAQPIAIREEPDDWGVDALILSASGEVEVRNPPGRILNGGTPGKALTAARRVSPAIIQNNRYWRERLAGDLTPWKEAVAEEFAALRLRQDAELEGISG